MSKKDIELYESEKWEHCTESAIRKTTLGGLFAVPVALVLARALGPRIGIVCFGAGFGSGMAYTECKYKYEKGFKFDSKIVAEFQEKLQNQEDH